MRGQCPRCATTNKPREYQPPSDTLFYTCKICDLHYQEKRGVED